MIAYELIEQNKDKYPSTARWKDYIRIGKPNSSLYCGIQTYICTRCEYICISTKTNFCPNCGADMRDLTQS